MKFDLVHYSKLNRESFSKCQTWAQYYEPDDIETLVDLGFNRNTVKTALENVGWSDEYWFAVPKRDSVWLF